jgi:hypothetical protein
MITIERLIKIACYYNRIKTLEFHRDYANKRIKDSRAIVYHILSNKFNYSIKDIANLFKKTDVYVFEIIEHHNDEYNVINHYTSMYQNVESQLENWNKTDLDLQYALVKTKYDIDIAEKYELILNENCKLKDQLEKINRKKNNYYV